MNVRQSSFRHIFATTAHPDLFYNNVPYTDGSNISNSLKCNGKYWTVPVKGISKGALGVQKYSCTGNQPENFPYIYAHSDLITDFDLASTNDDIIVTASTDGTMKLWQIPDDGIQQPLKDPKLIIGKDEYFKRCVRTLFHPCTHSVLASAHLDYQVRIWDLEENKTKITLNGHKSAITSLYWNRDGSQLATGCKDKKLRMYDPRKGCDPISEFQTHKSPKGSNVVWLDNLPYVFTTGFNLLGERQICLYDIRNVQSELFETTIDTQAALLYPLYDADTNLIYLAGKGDGLIRIYEITNEKPHVHSINNIRVPAILSLAMLPKRSVDVKKCEIAKIFNLTSKKQIQPMSFIVPRQSPLFQEDIFPPAKIAEPSITSKDWFDGNNAEPKTQSLKPEGMKSVYEVSVEEGGKIKPTDQTEEDQTKEEEEQTEVPRRKRRARTILSVRLKRAIGDNHLEGDFLLFKPQNKSWSKKYCIFQDVSLYIYNDKDEKTIPSLIINVEEFKFIGQLDEVEKEKLKLDEDHDESTFKIETEKDVIYLCAPDSEAQRQWIDLLNLMKQMYEEYDKEDNSESTKLDVLTTLGIKEEEEGKLTPRLVFDFTLIKLGKQKLLFRIKGKKIIRCVQVECTWKSLNPYDVFILDAGKTIIQWNGKKANRFKKARGLDIASRIKYKDRNGNAERLSIDQDSPEDNNKLFWDSLGGKHKIDDNIPQEDDIEFEQSIDRITKMYRVTKSSDRRKLVMDVHLNGRMPDKEILNSQSVFVLDSYTEIYVWIGMHSTKKQRDIGMSVAAKLQMQEGRPSWVGIYRLPENGENTLWKEKLTGYPAYLPIHTGAEIYKKKYHQQSNKVPHKPIVVKELFENKLVKESQPLVDDGKGDKMIWIIDNGSKSEFPKDMYGHFFRNDSYLVHYSWLQPKADKASHLIYYWQGSTSHLKIKGTSALLAVDLDESIGHIADEIRVEEGSEPEHLMLLFGGAIIIHKGNLSDFSSEEPRLYLVHGCKELNVHCTEIENESKWLNSNHVYLLKTKDEVFQWIGRFSNELERSTSVSCGETLKKFTTNKQMITIKEGEETDEFWKHFKNGKQNYTEYKHGEEGKHTHEPRLFKFTDYLSGKAMAFELPDITSSALRSRNVYMLQTLDELYLWFGKESSHQLKKDSMKIATEYAKLMGENIPIWVVEPGKEPISFMTNFAGWSIQTDHTIDDDPKLKIPMEEKWKLYDHQIYSYTRLLTEPLPEGVDRLKLETYLSEEEFEKVFKMTREEFNKLAPWRQLQEKEKVYLK